MVYQRRSRVSTVFCPRHNNSVVRRWSCFPEMLKIARNKRRSSCRRTVGDRWSHRAIGISFADSYPRSYRCKRCRWDIGMDTPVVRRWILRDISKEIAGLISSSCRDIIRSETYPFESVYQEAIHQRKETDDRRDYAIRKRLTRSRRHQRTPAFGVWIERRRGRKGDDPRAGERSLLLRNGTPQDRFPSMA